LKGYACINMYI